MSFEELIEQFITEGGDREAAYRSIANVMWVSEMERFFCSWRYAGDLVADGDKGEDYLDYYCSGGEGLVDEACEKFLNAHGFRRSTEDEV